MGHLSLKLYSVYVPCDGDSNVYENRLVVKGVSGSSTPRQPAPASRSLRQHIFSSLNFAVPLCDQISEFSCIANFVAPALNMIGLKFNYNLL